MSQIKIADFTEKDDAIKVTVSTPISGSTPLYFDNAEAAKKQGHTAASQLVDIEGVQAVLVAFDTITVLKQNDEVKWDPIIEQVEQVIAQSAAQSKGSMSEEEQSLFDQVQAVIDDQINPMIAAHGGSVKVSDVQGDIVFVTMMGGCQGCAGARATLQHGVEAAVMEAIPQVAAIVDATDHSAGENPYM